MGGFGCREKKKGVTKEKNRRRILVHLFGLQRENIIYYLTFIVYTLTNIFIYNLKTQNLEVKRQK